MMTTPGTSFSI